MNNNQMFNTNINNNTQIF